MVMLILADGDDDLGRTRQSAIPQRRQELLAVCVRHELQTHTSFMMMKMMMMMVMVILADDDLGRW